MTQVALITGASSGIGEEFARQLAAKGYDLVLTARRSDRLSALAAQLSTRNSVHTETIVADLAQDQGIAAVAARLGQGDVSLLVNNAGFGVGKKFAHSDIARQEALLSVHVLAPMRLMRVALPSMIERRSGGVINVASLAGFVSLPGNANYSATKAYLVRFSRAVHGEVRRKGVTVQALCPGFTVTEMHYNREKARHELRGPRFLWSSSEAVVRASLRAFARHQSLCVPGAVNKLMYWVAKLGVADAVVPLVVR